MIFIRFAAWILILPFFSCYFQLTNAVVYGGECSFDEMAEKQPPLPCAIIQNLPSSEKGMLSSYTFLLQDSWDPIRIAFSDEDLNDPRKYCTTFLGDNKHLDLFTENVTCLNSDILTPELRHTLTSKVLPRAMKLHTDRLLVRRLRVAWKVPEFMDKVCSQFTVPASHRSQGIFGADMMFYISATPMKPSPKKRAMAWSLPCAHILSRPVVGVMNFAPRFIEVNRHVVRMTAHQMAHALGFGYRNMHELGMLKNVSLRNKTGVVIVHTKQTSKQLQKHYKCEKVEGMELEDGEEGKTESHWERRNAKDELMAPFVGTRFNSMIGFYTAVTLAAFEDMGYFRANYSMAETMEWGKEMGCEFLNGSCVASGPLKYPKMFCNYSRFGEQSCPSDRLGVGRCVFCTTGPIIPKPFQYFANNRTGGRGYLLTDYCPVVVQGSNMLCSSTSNLSSMIYGSILSKNSWCLDGDQLRVRDSNRQESVGGVCVEVSCGPQNTVRVRYRGNDAFHDCPQGAYLKPNASVFVQGRIRCPNYNEVCLVRWDGSSALGSTDEIGYHNLHRETWVDEMHKSNDVDRAERWGEMEYPWPTHIAHVCLLMTGLMMLFA